MMVVSYGIKRPVGFINQSRKLYPATPLLVDAITTAAVLWYSQLVFVSVCPSTSLTDQTSAYLMGTKVTPVIIPLEEYVFL